MSELVTPLGAVGVLGLGLLGLGVLALGFGAAGFAECPWVGAWCTGRLIGLVTARPLTRREAPDDVDAGVDVPVDTAPVE